MAHKSILTIVILLCKQIYCTNNTWTIVNVISRPLLQPNILQEIDVRFKGLMSIKIEFREISGIWGVDKNI